MPLHNTLNLLTVKFNTYKPHKVVQDIILYVVLYIKNRVM